MKCPMSDGSYTPDYSLSAVDLKSFKNNLVDIIQQNKERWKELATQGTVVGGPDTPHLHNYSNNLGFLLLDVFFYKIHKLLLAFEI